MNKYSKLSQILHQQLLGNGEIVNFFIERIKTNSVKINLNKFQHIFITGLARAGTTALLKSIDSTNEFSSLRYKYMPFILSPRLAKLYSKLNGSKQIKETERLHGDGLTISSQTAECLDEPYWINTIYKNKNDNKRLTPHIFTEEYAFGYAYLLESFLNLDGQKRLVIKNNNHHLRLTALASYFSNSIFLVVFRSPLAQAKSLLQVHKRLTSIQNNDQFVLDYMNLIGHWEFGKGKKPFIYKDAQEKILQSFDDMKINYWLKQWIYTYEWLLNVLSKNNNNNIKLVCYEDLCTDPEYKNKLYNKLMINENSDKFKFKVGVSNSKDHLLDMDKDSLEYANNIYTQLKDKSLNDICI